MGTLGFSVPSTLLGRWRRGLTRWSWRLRSSTRRARSSGWASSSSETIAAAIAKEGTENAKEDNGKAGKASTEAVKAEGGEVLEAAPQAAAKAKAKAKTKAKAQATAQAQAQAKRVAQNVAQDGHALGAGADAENDDVVKGRRCTGRGPQQQDDRRFADVVVRRLLMGGVRKTFHENTWA